jgi:hypothetical protein
MHRDVIVSLADDFTLMKPPRYLMLRAKGEKMRKRFVPLIY